MQTKQKLQWTSGTIIQIRPVSCHLSSSVDIRKHKLHQQYGDAAMKKQMRFMRDFRISVDENCALLKQYAASSGNFFWYITNKIQNYRLFISGKLLYMFRVVSLPIIRSTHNCIYSIWYLSNSYCYLPLLWKIWNWFECGVGIVFVAVADVSKQPPN